MIYDDRYTVETPENIEFGYDIAGIGSRFLAAIIDTLLIIVAEVVVFLLARLVAGGLLSGDLASSVIAALVALLAFAIFWGYYLGFEMLWNGQSPGKRMIGLRVVRAGGRPVTFLSSAIRNLIRIVDFMPSFYGIGVVTMFIDAKARRLGDLAAGTLVVKERRAVTLESLTAGAVSAPLSPPPGLPLPAPTLPNVERLNDQDYDLVQEFLRRRAELSNEARARLAAQLASGIQARLELPQGGDAERFLQYVASEYQLYKHAQAE